MKISTLSIWLCQYQTGNSPGNVSSEDCCTRKKIIFLLIALKTEDSVANLLGYCAGITIHDIRFQGERIVYELSLQEQYVAYSGYGGSGQAFYLDSAIGLGLATLPLRRGVDCPEHALYLPILNMGVFRNRRRTRFVDAICIFEEDSQITEWRHTHLRGRIPYHSIENNILLHSATR